MNGTMTATTTTTTVALPRTPKPPPTGPAPAPPSGSVRQPHPAVTNGKSKAKVDPAAIDPAAMYESLKSRIAALEEEEVFVEEEERRYGARVCTSVVTRPSGPYMRRPCATAEEAQKQVRGLEENAVHVKYIELVRVCRPPSAPLARVLSAHSLQSSSAWSASTRRRNRSCSRTRTLVYLFHLPLLFFSPPDVNAAKGQLTKANQTKIKMENLARELQKVRHVSSASAYIMS
jgi:hypothetical protein